MTNSTSVKPRIGIFSPQGLNTLIGGLTHHGAQYEAWQLTEIWVDNSEQQEHVVGFIDPKTNTAHYLKVQSLHLSLGATAFQPEQTPMCTATGVSYTAIVHGELRGGPIVCGASNHVVPLAEPVKIQGEYFTLIRGTCGASIGPRHLGKHSQAFLAQDAISLLKHTELSLGMEMDLIEVRGCHRVISGDNFAEIKALQHAGVTVDNIILSQGWGGGGLTTAGRVAADIFAAAPSRAELSPQTFKLSA